MILKKNAEYIFTISNFWDATECEKLISKSETIGFSRATVNTEIGPRFLETVRNNDRVIYTDHLLADTIWEKLKELSPKKFGKSTAIGLNEQFRFYKYLPGQTFKKHRDQSFIRNEVEASYFTLMIYLNDNFLGGETTFNSISIKPCTGTALIFEHGLEHEGTKVDEGVKYVLRTDIMFRCED